MPAAATSPARRLESAAVAELVGWVRRTLGLTYREIGALAGATTRTAQRWGDPEDLTVPSLEHRPALDHLREMRRLLEAAFPDADTIVAWVHRAVPLLEGRRPIDLVRRGELEPVLGVLAGVYAGAFA
jgi:hypothetical protein